MIATNDINVAEQKDVVSSVDETSPISPDLWDTLSDNALLDQKNLLVDRWEFLSQKGYPYAKDVLEAIFKLDTVIASRH